MQDGVLGWQTTTLGDASARVESRDVVYDGPDVSVAF